MNSILILSLISGLLCQDNYKGYSDKYKKSHNSLKFPENFYTGFSNHYPPLIQYGGSLWGGRIQGGGIILSQVGMTGGGLLD